MIRQRVRIRFSKLLDLRWISHRDLLSTLERLFRRAELKLSMTEGFHPRPRMTFPSALGLGMAALDEKMELELAENLDADELLSRLRQHTVAGLDFLSVEVLAPHTHKGQVDSVVYEFQVPADRREDVARSIEQFLDADSHLVVRPSRKTPIDIRRDVQSLELVGDRVRMQFAMPRDASVRPRDLLTVLDLADLEGHGSYLTRTSVRLQLDRVL